MEFEIKESGERIRMYRTKDLEEIFHIGSTTAYQLMRSSGFPSIKINRSWYVEEEALRVWVKAYRGKEFLV